MYAHTRKVVRVFDDLGQSTTRKNLINSFITTDERLNPLFLTEDVAIDRAEHVSEDSYGIDDVVSTFKSHVRCPKSLYQYWRWNHRVHAIL